MREQFTLQLFFFPHLYIFFLPQEIGKFEYNKIAYDLPFSLECIMTYKGKHTKSECMMVRDFYGSVLSKRVGPRSVIASHPKVGIIILTGRAEVFQDRFR